MPMKLTQTTERDEIARIIRDAYERDLASINGDACFEYRAADALLARRDAANSAAQ